MPSKTAPFSIRLGPELLAQVDAYAKQHGCTRHGAVLIAVKKLVGGGNTPSRKRKPKDMLRVAEAHAVHLAKPLDTSMVPLNPQRAPMQKTAKPSRRWKV